MNVIQWLDGAVEDVMRAQRYIAIDNPIAADRQVRLILDAVASLARFPLMGRAGRVPGTREVAVTGTPFVVVYDVTGAKVTVLAVLHGRQRWPAGF